LVFFIHQRHHRHTTKYLHRHQTKDLEVLTKYTLALLFMVGASSQASELAGLRCELERWRRDAEGHRAEAEVSAHVTEAAGTGHPMMQKAQTWLKSLNWLA